MLHINIAESLKGPELKMSKDATTTSANLLLVLLWASGAAIFGWLLAGVIYGRDYPNLTGEKLGWADWLMALLAGLGVGGLSYGIFWCGSKSKKTVQENRAGALLPIIVALLPALFLLLALATLVLTFATYSPEWKDARQGLATALAALIAAVGVVISVSVSYKSGEENRLAQEKNLVTQLKAQQDNLKTQLEHQREIEDEKGRREERKQDAELIKTLNDRLHEIISRRYGDNPAEVSASYFQLAALYRDWETLAASSKLVEGQKDTQQRNILKILFGVYEEGQSTENSNIGSGDSQDNAEEKQKDIPSSRPRSQTDIRALNSVIQDIFPVARKEKSDGNEAEEKTQKGGEDKVYDLSHLDLRGLDFSYRHLNGANLVGAHLEGANLWCAHLEGANLVGAHLEGTDLWGAHLEGAHLWGAYLEGAHFFLPWENKDAPKVRQYLIDQLKIAEGLPTRQKLLIAEGFDEDLVDQIFQTHEAYRAEKRKSQVF